MTTAQLPTETDITNAIDRAKLEILSDIDAGHIPADATTFAALHDHVDANEYGGLTDEGSILWIPDADTATPNDIQHAADALNRVQHALDDWMRAGRPEH